MNCQSADGFHMPSQQASPCIPLVSVVIPYHNERDLLPRAIDSVNRQLFTKPVEIVVVDDASEVLPSLPADSRFPVRCIRSSTNLYAGGARNLGVQHSKGDYICFLDSDDEYLPERISSQFEFLERHREVVFVGSPYYIVTDKSSLIVPATAVNILGGILDRETVLPTSYQFEICRGYAFPTPGITFRRAAWDQIGGFETKYCWGEEYDLQVRLAQLGRVGFVPTPAMNYIYREGSICRTVNPQKQVSAARMYESWYSTISGLPANIRRELRSRAHREWLLAAQLYLEHSHDSKNALSCAWQAMRQCWSIWGMRTIVRMTLHRMINRVSLTQRAHMKCAPTDHP